MFRNKSITFVHPLFTLENGVHCHKSNSLLYALYPKRSICWLAADKLKYAAALNTEYEKNKMINAVNENSQYEHCIECGRLFTQHPLSQKSKRSSTCIGCARYIKFNEISYDAIYVDTDKL